MSWLSSGAGSCREHQVSDPPANNPQQGLVRLILGVKYGRRAYKVDEKIKALTTEPDALN